jgi:phosphodiesterase/alkaline phosphatase D-like protein
MVRAGVLAFLLLVPAAGSSGAAGPGFPLGVAAGDVTARSARLWTRAPRAGGVELEVATDPGFGAVAARPRAAAAAAADRTVSALVRGLAPGTRYVYRFRQGSAVSEVGRFVTAPAASADAPVRFAISGDADGTLDPATGRPAFDRFEVYARMAAERNDFNLNVGDTIYSDSRVGGGPPALTLAAKRAKYRLHLSYSALRELRASAALYSHWDDHEFVNDFSREEHGEAVFAAGRQAFLEYAPATWSRSSGLYRTFRWGRNVELFLLDERSFRSAKASAGGACDAAGTRDPAPTAPQALRASISLVVPRLATPPPPACLDRIRDPRRTMLGARQLEAFVRAVTRSTATWKVVVNEVPIQQFYALPYDRWEGYEAERTRLLERLRGVRNVVFLATDLHGNFITEVRLRTLEEGGAVPTGIWEVVTGPVATHTYSDEVDAALGAPGAATAVTALFYKPQPPRGVGMRCAATDVFSYAQVRATRRTLTVTPKDARGRRVRERLGGPCGPLVLRSQ